MNIEDRIRRAIGDFVIQIHALQIRVEELEAELKAKIEGKPQAAVMVDTTETT